MVTEMLHQWANALLLWVGFGTVAGLIAKAVIPGRDSGGTIATLFMGIGGTIIGCGLVSFFWSGYHVSPLTPLGFLAGVLGATILLGFHRLLSGRLFREEGTGVGVLATPTTRRRKTVTVAVKE